MKWEVYIETTALGYKAKIDQIQRDKDNIAMVSFHDGAWVITVQEPDNKPH